VDDDWYSCQQEKLFWPIARHPVASSGGGNNGGVHEEKLEPGTVALAPSGGFKI
jgi:hypothetical protein